MFDLAEQYDWSDLKYTPVKGAHDHLLALCADSLGRFHSSIKEEDP